MNLKTHGMKDLLFVSIFIFTAFILNGQEWKQYPYTPSKSLISFPLDEGYHPQEPEEWWYTTAHLKGKTTGEIYTVMLTYFSKDTLGFDGFRILNFSNETNHRFFDDTKPCNYPKLDATHLNIEANLLTHTETWTTSKDSTGELIPFEYDIKAKTKRGSIDFHYTTNKRPLILADTGYFNQGLENYTYYYSLTGIDVTGTISFLGVTEEVEGEAWIDRQYGSFNPYTGEEYEWMSLRLSNGMDINLWNVFTADSRVPDLPTYRLMGIYIDEDNAVTTADFSLERLKFQSLPREGNVYASQFRLIEKSLGIDIIINAKNDISEVRRPFFFYEGPIDIDGSVNGNHVTGSGFTELLHQYQIPEVTLINPIDIWNLSEPIMWQLDNPDDARPIKYDIAVRYEQDSIYTNIASDLGSNQFLWDGSRFSLDSLLWLRISAYSIDSFLSDSIYSQVVFPLITANSNIIFDDDIMLYPNPSSDIVQILNLKKNENYSYIIYDLSGINIINKALISPNDIIDISSLKPGLHYILLDNGINRSILKFLKH